MDYASEEVGWDAYEGEEDAASFFRRWLEVALTHCRLDVPVYQWHAHKRQALVQDAWEKAGLLLHQQIIWTKARGVFTRSHFQLGVFSIGYSF